MQTLRLALLAGLAPLAFAQAPPQFEVASIKPSAPSADMRVNLGYHVDGAMVTCSRLTLLDYIRMAWQIKDFQISGPEWLKSGGDRFDIVGRLPEGGKPDQVRDMLKALLIERFHLQFHNESKDFPVYALVVLKSGIHMTENAVDDSDIKGKPPTEVAASGGPEGVAIKLGKGSFNFGNNTLQVTKLDMPNFANVLTRFVDRPVVDMTGLTGTYDFSFKLTDEDYMVMQIRAGLSAGVPMPPQALKMLDIPSGDSLHSGLQSVGLKLDPRKAPLPVLVIDKADKTPTDN
jgi:uncharacterized protein (TIGR03435 family)